MEVKDVIFLGGGASVSEGAPRQKDLLREYAQICRTRSGSTISNETEQRLTEFFETFFGIDIKHGDLSNLSFPTFEEVLGILELSINREESFKGYSLAPDDARIQRTKEDLIFLIATVLDRKLRGEAKYHIELVNRLKEEQKLCGTAFVSLNYDILIDNALVDLYPDFHLDYGVEFTNFQKRGEWKRPKAGKAVSLCKLHGSLNWLYCPACISLTLTPKEKRVATLVFKPQSCDVCGSEMIPIIIPPTFFKVMSNFHLQQIWRKAESALTQAETIFFCGYSFPDADIHIKYLLKRVEVNRGSTPEVFIINNHAGKRDYEREVEESRYKQFFRESRKVHYTTQSFESFCEHGIVGG